jgi:hypothetical protein
VRSQHAFLVCLHVSESSPNRIFGNFPGRYSRFLNRSLTLKLERSFHPSYMWTFGEFPEIMIAKCRSRFYCTWFFSRAEDYESWREGPSKSGEKCSRRKVHMYDGWNDLSNLRVKLLLRNLEYLPGKLPNILLLPVKKIKYNKTLTYILRSLFLEIPHWNFRADEKCREIRMVKVNVIFNDIRLLICLTPLQVNWVIDFIIGKKVHPNFILCIEGILSM